MENTFKIKATTTGFSSPAESYVDKRLNPLDILVKNTFTTYFIRASGNKYEINDGDILVVDKSLEPEENKLIIVEQNGRLEIDKFQMKSNKIIWGIVTFIIKKV